MVAFSMRDIRNTIFAKILMLFGLTFWVNSSMVYSQSIDIHSYEINLEQEKKFEYADSLGRFDYNLNLEYCLYELDGMQYYNKPGIYSAWVSWAIVASFQIGNIKMADSLYQILVNLPDDNLHPFLRAEILHNKSKAYKLYDKNSEAISAARDALLIYEQNVNIEGQIKLNNFLAYLLYHMGNCNMANQYFDQAYQLFPKTIDPELQLSNLVNGVRICICIKDIDKATRILSEATPLAEKLNDPFWWSRYYYAQAWFYYDQRNYRKSLVYFDKSIDSAIESHDLVFIAIAQTFKATVFEKLGDHHKALEINREALKIRTETGLKFLMATSYYNMATSFIHLGENDSAEYYIKKGEELYGRFNVKPDLVRGQELRMRVFLSKNDYKNAFKALEKKVKYNDSIFIESNKEKLDELESTIERSKFEQKKNEIEAEIRLQETQKESNLVIINLIFSFIGILLIFLALLYLYIKSRNRRNLIRITQKLVYIQLNSHFIFNALTAMQNLIYKNQTESAIHYLTIFSELLNRVVPVTQKKYVSLQEEINFVIEFLQLQQLRFGDALKYQIHIAPDIIPQKVMLPPMLSYPFLEYAAEECVQRSEEESLIEVHVFREGNTIFYRLDDVGLGFSELSACFIKRYGHQHLSCDDLIKQRISLYNSWFKKRITFAKVQVIRETKVIDALQFSIEI